MEDQRYDVFGIADLMAEHLRRSRVVGQRRQRQHVGVDGVQQQLLREEQQMRTDGGRTTLFVLLPSPDIV